LLCVSGSEGQLTSAHDILFWDQVIETDQSRFFVLRRILFGFSVFSIHAKPFDSDLFSGAEFEKCSPICQQRTVKHENRRLIRACRRGDRTTVCDSLTLLVATFGASAACVRFGFALNTAAAFDVCHGL